MANHLDLEEQEQLDELKHFWKQYGNLIVLLLFGVITVFAGWTGYQYLERTRSIQASALFDEVERIIATGDVAMAERAFGDMKERYGRTAYAMQSGLHLAKLAQEKMNAEVAKETLTWVADGASDEGYASVAKLRLAGLLASEKSFDLALKTLDSAPPAEFLGLFADRKGDILVLQNKPLSARSEYQKAHAAFADGSEYRRLVEIKLDAVGGQITSSQEEKK